MRTKQEYINLINSRNGFSENELIIRKETDITDLHYESLVKLFDFREWAGISTLITSAYRPGDSRSHGMGKAYDLILFDQWLKQTIDFMHLWRLATTFPWYGVGIYFDWSFTNSKGNKIPCTGVHVDNHTGGDRPLRWLRVTKEVEGKDQQLYYYQDVVSGLFYNSKLKESMELKDAFKFLRPV